MNSKITDLQKSNYEKFPEVVVKGHSCSSGWETIKDQIRSKVDRISANKAVVAIDCYPGVYTSEIINNLQGISVHTTVINAEDAFLSKQEINEMVFPFVTDDPVFGYMTSLTIQDFFDKDKLTGMQSKLETLSEGLVIVCGTGAALLAPAPDLLVYADMPRWEAQLRFRSNKISNLGVENKNDDFSYQYKRSFFVDWRVCDKHKVSIANRCDYFLDTTIPDNPKMVTGRAVAAALIPVTKQPFRVVPFFDPGPWGGQWLKEVCDLDRSQQNFAWAFDCVPEENSLRLKFDDGVFEMPSINLVFAHPKELLGMDVFETFGAEFPIRFDFLDTMGGGNLSLQVHPLLSYIREKFGMTYTQDESYYFMEAKEEAQVYLGLKDNIDADTMVEELYAAQVAGNDFAADRFVQKWPIKKHDHILIPSGTVHCSCEDSVVLEISATPFIFTFKLWDWGRMGLDGKPRPISLEHGKNAIQWNRRPEWVKDNLMDQVSLIGEGEGWREERTGLDETSFIETRRHWFTGKVEHNTNGTVNVLNLIEGAEIIVESPDSMFEPYVIHYAETFIVPATVGVYTIRPYGESVGQQCATIKAFVRAEKLRNYQIN